MPAAHTKEAPLPRRGRPQINKGSFPCIKTDIFPALFAAELEILAGGFPNNKPAVQLSGIQKNHPVLRLPHLGVPGKEALIVLLLDGEGLQLLQAQAIIRLGGAGYKGTVKGSEETALEVHGLAVVVQDLHPAGDMVSLQGVGCFHRKAPGIYGLRFRGALQAQTDKALVLADQLVAKPQREAAPRHLVLLPVHLNPVPQQGPAHRKEHGGLVRPHSRVPLPKIFPAGTLIQDRSQLRPQHFHRHPEPAILHRQLHLRHPFLLPPYSQFETGLQRIVQIFPDSSLHFSV